MEIMEQTLEILIPEMSKFYGIGINTPTFSTTNDQYDPKTAGRFLPFGTYGLIRMNIDEHSLRSSCSMTTAHELGHAAFYQNNPQYNHTVREHFSIRCLDEGIAQDFEMEGLAVLRKKEYFSFFEHLYQQTLIQINRKTDFVIKNKYNAGRKMKDHLKKRGVKVKDMIMFPLEYQEEIEKLKVFRQVRH